MLGQYCGYSTSTHRTELSRHKSLSHTCSYPHMQMNNCAPGHLPQAWLRLLVLRISDISQQRYPGCFPTDQILSKGLKNFIHLKENYVLKPSVSVTQQSCKTYRMICAYKWGLENSLVKNLCCYCMLLVPMLVLKVRLNCSPGV